MQQQLTDFTTDAPDDSQPDGWRPDFDDYGPTMDEPLSNAEEMEKRLPGTAGIDRRELHGTALSPTDFELLNAQMSPQRAQFHGFHPDDGRKESERGHFEKMMGQIRDSHKDGDSARSTPHAVADGGVAAADFDSLDELSRGAVLTLDKLEGEYLVVDRKEVPLGTVQSVDVVDDDGRELRLNVVALAGERYFDVIRGHETPVVKNTANIDDVRDFDVIRRDQQWLEEYLAETIPHFTA